MAKAIAILGAGSWGTALALLLARNSCDVLLWDRDREHLKQLEQVRTNQRYLPGFQLPNPITIAFDFEAMIQQSSDLLIVVPSHGFREILQKIKPYLRSGHRLVWGTKGLDAESGDLLSDVASRILGKEFPVALLSGPSFAKEVAMGLPTAAVIASHHAQFANDLRSYFFNPRFRVYLSDDVIGVQIAGAVKNIMAIAVGICDGLSFGANSRAALMTRGLAEMTRLGVALGGKSETFMGLAGVGDLILTCTDNQSRNRRFGLAIAQGKDVAAALKDIGQVVEGRANTRDVFHLAERHRIEMPITEQVYRILYQHVSVTEAVESLLSRGLQ